MIAPEILDIPRIFGIAELEMVEICWDFWHDGTGNAGKSGNFGHCGTRSWIFLKFWAPENKKWWILGMMAPEILDIPRIFGIAELEMVEIAGIFGMMELEMLENPEILGTAEPEMVGFWA